MLWKDGSQLLVDLSIALLLCPALGSSRGAAGAIACDVHTMPLGVADALCAGLGLWVCDTNHHGNTS